MKIILVDDEKLALDYMESLLHRVEPQANFVGFTDVDAALAYLSVNDVDVALLDIEMGKYSGIEFAKKCKKACPKINIIFVTGYSQYTIEALQLHASGYLMKPVRPKDLRMELDNLLYPVPIKNTHRVRIQTFGNFEVFVDNQPLKLPLSKCKESLAYLVDRKGALVNMPELANVLWEDRLFDRSLRNNIHQLIFTLMKTLREVHAEEIIIKYPREIAIDTSKVDCDYFRALSGDMAQMNLFTGEYMKNYSWAEFTVGKILLSKR